jgi:hypothetical protein
MRRPQFLRAAAVGVIAAGGLILLSRMAPLQWPSTLAYSGLVLMLAGVLSVFVPPRWLGLSKRGSALLAGVLAGAALFAAGWFWPAASFRTSSPATRLDAFMPEYNFEEHHEITIQAPPDRVRYAIDHVSFSDLPEMRTLGRVRNIAMGVRASGSAPLAPTPIVEVVKNGRSGFFALDDTPREFVIGLAGQPWNNRAVRLKSEEFRAWAAPGNIKVAANFLIEDAGNGRSRVITETRIAATDDAARAKMAKYWTLIYPGSGMVRHSLLEAVRARAERP